PAVNRNLDRRLAAEKDRDNIRRASEPCHLTHSLIVPLNNGRLRATPRNGDAVSACIVSESFSGHNHENLPCIGSQILGVELRRQRRRAHKIAEHHGQLPALGAGILLGAATAGASASARALSRRAARAARSLRRWPIEATPRPIRSSAVSS